MNLSGTGSIGRISRVYLYGRPHQLARARPTRPALDASPLNLFLAALTVIALGGGLTWLAPFLAAWGPR